MAEWPKLKKDYAGLKVRLKRTLKNGIIEIPAGKVCTIESWYRGACLRTDPCECCGVRVYITKVPQSALELLEKQE
jgi:hypothetical protein